MRYLIRGDREVDDVVQEVLVSVLRGLDGYRGEGSFQSWSDRVAARTTFAWLRRRRAHEQRELSSPGADFQAASVGPNDEFLSRRHVLSALDGLPDKQRHVLLLHHVFDMSIPEIADETRAPIETVRSRLRLGKLCLREALAPAARKVG